MRVGRAVHFLARSTHLRLQFWRTEERSAKLGWWEPRWSRWSHVAKVWHEWRQLLQPRSAARIAITSALVGATTIAACKFANPGMNLGFLWNLPTMLLGLVAFLLVTLLLQVIVPCHVEVSSERVATIHGEDTWFANRDMIIETRIVVFASDRIRLRILYSSQGNRRTRLIGVDPRIDLDQLSLTMPMKPSVQDARERFRRLSRV